MTRLSGRTVSLAVVVRLANHWIVIDANADDPARIYAATVEALTPALYHQSEPWIIA